MLFFLQRELFIVPLYVRRVVEKEMMQISESAQILEVHLCSGVNQNLKLLGSRIVHLFLTMSEARKNILKIPVKYI